MKKWSLECIDIRATFLQSGNINREVILMPPKEANESGFWRLKKTVYGLHDAARSWYFSVKTKLCSLGCSVSVDPGVFTWVENCEISGIVCLHSDDFLIAGYHSFHQKVLTPFIETFEVGSHQKKQFKYLGWEFTFWKLFFAFLRSESIKCVPTGHLHGCVICRTSRYCFKCRWLHNIFIRWRKSRRVDLAVFQN